MRPPKGFEAEKFPLRHKLQYGYTLSMGDDTFNTAFMPIVRSAKNIAAGALTLPNTIQTNPHNANYEEDVGPLCNQMSIIDRLTISLKFNLTKACESSHIVSPGTASANFDGASYSGDDIQALTFLWRPIFNVFPEKMDAADDDTTNTVAAILGMTKDNTNEDVVAVTTTDLPGAGPAELTHPMSTVNGVEVFGDYNMGTNTIMEEHVFDEDLLQRGLRRFTNKGALRSCLGRTRHVTLTRARPFANFYIDKFVPRAIRRIQPFAMFGIQVHMPEDSHVSQYFLTSNASTSGHLGVKMIAQFHEWNNEHDMERGVPG